MANFYVRSAAAGAGTGANWANAFTTLTLALSGRANTDVLWVADDHAESTASAVTLTCPTTPGLQILGVNTHTTEPPTALNSTPAAAVAVGAASQALTIAGFAYVAAVKFQGGTANSAVVNVAFGNAGNPSALFFDGCAFEDRGGSSAIGFSLGPAAGSSNDHDTSIFQNCTWKFAHAAHMIFCRSGRFIMRGCSFDASGSTPTTLLTGANDCNGSIYIEASDLSGESWANLVSQAWTASYDVTLRSCKLPSGTALATGTHSGPGGVVVRMTNCDSGDTQLGFGFANYTGTILEETTIVRSGGGAVSFRFDSSANAKFPYLPLAHEVAMRKAAGSYTCTIEYVADANVAAGQGTGTSSRFKNSELWQEVQHQDTSGSPLGVIDRSDRSADVFAAAADQDTSSVTWTTTGMTTPTKGKLVSAITPAEDGYVQPKAFLGLASKTVYIDLLGATIA